VEVEKELDRDLFAEYIQQYVEKKGGKYFANNTQWNYITVDLRKEV
jgi:hypothetical protein